MMENELKKKKEFPLTPLNSSVVLSTIYMFLNFLYGSIAWAKVVSKYSTVFCLEYPETTSPEHGLKNVYKSNKHLHKKTSVTECECTNLEVRWLGYT